MKPPEEAKLHFVRRIPITAYAVESRYPGDDSPLRIEEITKAVTIADQTQKAITAALGNARFPFRK